MAQAAASPGPRDARGQPSARAERRWMILVVVAVAQLMVVLDSTIVNIALPSAQHALGFANSDRQWVVTGYALAFGSLLLVGGRLGDMYNRKWVFITGLIGFAVASAIGGAAVSFVMLVAARAVQGAFGAILAPSALGTLVSTFRDPRERGRAFAVFGSVAAGGGAVGLILGGVLTQYLSWRYTLFVNLIFAAIAVAGAPAYIPGHPAADGLAWRRAGLRRAVPHRLWLLPRRDGRLDRHADPRLAGPRRGPAHRVRRSRTAIQSPAAAAEGHPRPHPGQLLRRGRHHRNCDLRHFPVPHLLHAAGQGIQPADHRAPVPAAGGRDPGRLHLVQCRGPAPGRAPPSDHCRHAAGRRRDSPPGPAHRDLQLPRRCAARPAHHGPGLRHDLRAGDQHGHGRRPSPGLRRGLGAGQHDAAGWRIDRHLHPQHHRGERDDQLPHRPPHGPSGTRDRGDPRLHPGLHDLGRAARARRDPRDPYAALTEAA